jgi:hypothetical protein
MPRTLSNYQKDSKRANSRAVRRARAVFDPSYAIARQVLELRDKHGLTQVELAKAGGVPQSRGAQSLRRRQLWPRSPTHSTPTFTSSNGRRPDALARPRDHRGMEPAPSAALPACRTARNRSLPRSGIAWTG